MDSVLVIRNGTLVLEDGELRDGMLVVRGDRIEYVGPRNDEIPPGCEIVDARGAYISPGFIDIHVHGGAGSDFMDATPDAVANVFRYHLGHGTTSLCPTTATAPLGAILRTLEALDAYRSGRQEQGRALGAHIEGPFLANTKRGCHLPEHLRNPEDLEWRPMLERYPIAGMTLAPELPGARALIEALRRQGSNANAGHSEALYHEISEATDWGVSHVTHLYCAMTDAMNNRWRGTPNPRTAGIVEAVYLDERLSSELITDGKHLSGEMLRLALRNKGHQGLAIVTDAMRGAGMPDGEYTFGPSDGMRAIVRDGEARIPDGTALASSVYPMDAMVRTFRELTGCAVWRAVHMASLTPARIVHVQEETGSLRPGKFADVIVFDEAVNIRDVIQSGRRMSIASQD